MRSLGFALLILLASLAPSAAAIPLICTPANAVCVGEDEFVWHSDDQCTDANSYYHWTDRVQAWFLVGSVHFSSQRECRNQVEQYGEHYDAHWWQAHAGVIFVGAVMMDWREHTDEGEAPVCTMDLRLVLVVHSPGCVAGPPPEGPITP